VAAVKVFKKAEMKESLTKLQDVGTGELKMKDSYQKMTQDIQRQTHQCRVTDL
jgi:hypothetical protein